MRPATVLFALVLLCGACTSGHPTARLGTARVTAPTTAPSTTTSTATATSTTQPVRPPTTTRAPALPPRPCCSTTPGGPLRVSFTGLTPGQRVPNDGRVFDFTVTFTNNTSTNYPSVGPVVVAEWYDGAPGDPEPEPTGRLQRYNPRTGIWDDIYFTHGTGMDFINQGDDAAFALPPGHSVTVQYRISLTPDDRPGTMPINGIAAKIPRPDRGTYDVGNIAVPLNVVSS